MECREGVSQKAGRPVTVVTDNRSQSLHSTVNGRLSKYGKNIVALAGNQPDNRENKYQSKFEDSNSTLLSPSWNFVILRPIIARRPTKETRSSTKIDKYFLLINT